MTREIIAAMLKEDADTWAELVAILDAHPEVNLHAPGSKPWNSRDAYAHLARWMEYNAAKINAAVAGKPIPVVGESVEEVNARWEAEDASLSLDEARQWAVISCETRKRVVESIPVSRWDSEIEQLARIEGASHFREHLSYITLADNRPYPSSAAEPEKKSRGGGMYEIVVEKHFEAAHYLRGYQGKCEAMHGHRYRVAVRIKTSQLNEIGLAYDFGDVKLHLNQIMERYDHTCLNDVAPFDTINPSAENIASTIYDELNEKLAAEPVTLAAVEAWETPHQGVV
ncbi:MAG: 6-carboxytetrahydropterin synthase QueD, partial [Dehalococcoidales bacterium]|nr:6-carboxytetrahydropterin synthase QueD [Dehalococcoidales bacterium]